MSTITYPASHLDLLESRNNAVLTTLLPDGMPHTTPVWFLRNGDNIELNTMREFRKTKNMRANDKVTLIIYDPKNPFHNLEIRGTVIEMDEDGAMEHLNRLTERYLQKEGARFFGDSVPEEEQERFHPTRIVIRPTRIRAE